MNALFGNDDSASVDLDEQLYSRDVIFRVAYDFTDRCFLLLSRPFEGIVRVAIVPKNPSGPLRDAAGAFLNALVDYRLRATIERDTRAIRELLVAQAFSDAELLDHSGTEADYKADPRGIARWQ